MKNPITAISEGNCRLDNPLIACPDVQPPAHREPNPTKKPPSTKMVKPFKVNRLSQQNNSSGANSPLNEILSKDSSAMVALLKIKGSGFDNRVDATPPPRATPRAKTKFHF